MSAKKAAKKTTPKKTVKRAAKNATEAPAKKAGKRTTKKTAVKPESKGKETTKDQPVEKSPSPPSEEAPDSKPEAADEHEGERNNTRPRPSPYRESVANLAAQIVSAQISGIAQHEVLSAIWTGLRSALISIGEVLDERHATGDKPGQSQPRYRAAIERTRGFIPKPDVLLPIGQSDVRTLTQSALRYAETLLSPSHTDEGIVFAEQMFDFDEELSENGIRLRFRKFDWKSLNGVKTFRKLITDVDSWYAAWLEDTSQENPTETPPPRAKPSKLAILVQAKKILDEMAARPEPLPELSNDASKALARVNRALAGVPVTEIPRSQIRTTDYDMIDWLYCGETPESRSASRSQESEGKAETRRYRPWGVFRYLRLFGEDEAAKSLNEKLKIPKADLNPDQFLEALCPDLYGMHVIERIVNGPDR